MAIFRGTIRSRVLEMDTSVQLIVPFDRYDAQGSCTASFDKTIILLHGLKQNADSWARMTGLERYAAQHGFCCVMPEVQRSFYCDMVYGMKYFTYVSEELPELAARVFRLPADHDHLYAGGLSMGGFGAMKLALTDPGRYAGAVCLSSAFSLMAHLDEYPAVTVEHEAEFAAISGTDLRGGGENDPETLARKAAASGHRPRFYIACGTDDPLLADSRATRDILRRCGYDVKYEEWPGDHDWNVWDRGIRRGMAWFAGNEEA